jgi:hypothetical protein
MNKLLKAAATVIALSALFLAMSCASQGAQATNNLANTAKDSGMKHRIHGPFDVTLKPQTDDPNVGDPAVGRMSIDKQFHGDLEAVSKGQMLGVRTAVKDSAGYVPMERVVGTLAGRTGSFVLQHNTTMNRGVPQQSIIVVPDSGTDQLAGLTGAMTIDITDGKHFYNFEYGFDAAAKP